ncbi:outer membrane protein transport protein [Thiomicrorhabdus sp. ZW0627]|uniref:OmpP1/FadL family transporter n=1 Tax=Thiomicrorhabdus sp. ZW0627 TaxID=3039774 RepID=UPI0024365F6E|nr:outer membrane protein transport protein [Thiomicrorhabdus sp. ZW0627]MDG6773561.1 outer membrane protein transport protein [Thiomicrorhabdus sp. ZW0627]
MMSLRFPSAMTAVATLLTPVVAGASGFALIEQSASGQGMSYAGAAANSEDASVMWFNPAALTDIKGRQLIAGGHVIMPKTEFTNNGSYAFSSGNLISGDGDNGATVGFVPNLYWTDSIGDYQVGLGINVPFGQHVSYDSDWVGRYHATETDLKTLNINPSVARKVNEKLSLGFGLNAQYLEVVLEQKLNQSALGDADANAKVTGSNWAYGYNLGLMYKPTDRINLGLAYRSAMKHDVNGRVDYTGVNSTTPLPLTGSPTLADIFYDAGVSAKVSLPATASLAVDYEASSQLHLLASSTWTGWGEYDELVLSFDNGAPDSETNQNFKDSWRFALGGYYQLNDRWKIRTGAALDKTPVPDKYSRSPRTPDSDRTWISLGTNYRYSDKLSVDVGYSHLFGKKGDVEYSTGSSPLGPNVLIGSYDTTVDIVSAQLVWKY